MKKFIFPMALAVLLIPGAKAQSVFDGTWKANYSTTTFPSKPDEMLLKDGMFSCKTCYVSYTVKADGTDQPITGDPYRNTVAVKVISDHEVQWTSKKDGKIVATLKSCISSDGATVTTEFSDSSASNGGPPVTGKYTSKRVGQKPAGAHAISGEWRQKHLEGVSDNGALYTFKVKGDEITMTTPTGQSYTARMDGTEAPVKGDPGSTSVRVRLIGKNTLEETYLLNGKPQLIYRTAVGPDGKHAKVSTEDKLQNRTTTTESVKQE